MAVGTKAKSVASKSKSPCKAKERKFRHYNALEVALRRSGMKKAGAVATLLFELFLEDGSRLQSTRVVSHGICDEGCFTKWRDEMIKGGWLVWSNNQSDKGIYFAGKLLIPYLNKERMATREIVSRDEVLIKGEAASKTEVEVVAKDLADERDERLEMSAQFRQELEQIRTQIVEMSRLLSPPVSEEDLLKARELNQKMSSSKVVQN